MDRLAASRAQRAAQAHEMSVLNSQPLPNGVSAAAESSAFLAEVSSIQDGIEQINLNVSNISTLHARIMSVIDEGKQQDTAQLDQLAADTRALSNDIKERIRALEVQPASTDAQMRRNRIAFVKSKFLEALQRYQRVEHEYRAKSRQRVERQLKIVKPDATDGEIAEVVEGGGSQIFAQALSASSRYGESRLAYREVQTRQQEIRKMEETLMELAQMMNDVALIVEQQDAIIENIESTAKDVEGDTEKAVKHTRKAVIHARNYRKGRWICFFVFLIIAAVLAIVLGVVFGRR